MENIKLILRQPQKMLSGVVILIPNVTFSNLYNEDMLLQSLLMI